MDARAGLRRGAYNSPFIVAILVIALLASGCAGLVSSSSTKTPPPPDAPAISGVSPTQVTSSTATISWATNEPSDSQVYYGISAAYGAISPLSGTMVTAHSLSLTGLTAGTLYHFQVKSRNAAGNLAASGDFTFTTASGQDTTPPVVSVTSPTSGATVSGIITVSATASDNVGVSWVQFQVDGANHGSQITSAPYALSLDTTKLSNGNHALSAIASDAAGNRTTSASVTIDASNASAPSITSQPSSQTVVAGQTAKFTVAAMGTAPLTYQWKRNGTNISGATSASYTTPPTTTADSGSTFQVVVSNSAGSASSNTASLTVNATAAAPTITSQPSSRTVTVGQTATFSVTATGTAPLTYQWKRNGTNISGATSASYTTSPTTIADSGSTFQVVVSNSAGSASSNTATLTVNTTAAAPAITSQPSDQSVTAGQTATFTVTATGTAPLSYQWKKNGADIPGATSSTYTTAATSTADDGSTFQVVVSNVAGSTSSNLAVLSVTSVGGASPAQLVQHVSSSNTRGGGSVNNAFSSPYCYHFQLPNYTTAGNALVVGFTFNGNPVPSVSDDKGDTFTVRVNYFDSANTQSIGIATAFPIAAGARVISVCFSSDPGGYTQPMATEFDNVIGIDGTAIASQGTGTTVTAGNLTPSVSGDLAYQVVFSLSANQSHFTSGSQSNISWNLLSADLLDGWAAQYGTYTSTASINPTLTMGASQKWISAGILLKTGASGGIPSGMRIVHLVHENIPYHANAGGTDNPFPNPTTVQFPSSGNLLVAMIGGGYIACTVTGVADTNNNSWTQAGSTEIQANNDVTQAYYAANANSSGNLGLTVHWSATNGDFTFFLYDVAGAATSPFDTAAGGTGSQSSAGNLTMPFTITPAQAGELVFAEVIWDYNTGAGLVGTGWLFDTNTFDGENQSGPEPIDQNNGWGHYWTTGTSPVTITWKPQYAGLPTGNWSAVAVAFKPAP